MTTISQLVDKMILETKRPDMLADITTYVNQTIRELHSEPTRGSIVYFRDNLKEDLLVSNVSSGFYWDLPKPSVFQGVAAARFDSVFSGCDPVWAKELEPGRGMSQSEAFFYRAGTRIFFVGNGGVNSTISFSWYEFPPSLKYYASGTRPAIYDEELGWTYAPAYDTNAAQRLLAQQITSNWILLRWPTVVEEGVRAKIYKRTSDTERARTSYSMYSTLRQGFYTSERALAPGIH